MAKGEHVRVPLRVGAGVAAGVLLAVCASSARGGQYFADFNDGNVGAALLFGSAGVDNGSLRLTQNLESQQGSMVIDNLDAGQAIQSFTANFSLAIGPNTATPADGISFNFGVPPAGSFGEAGFGTGLVVALDIYQNNDPPPAESPPSPEVRVRVNGVQVFSADGQATTGGQFIPAVVRYDASGLDLTFGGSPVFTDVPLPGFTPQAGYQFGFGARTGGLSAEQRIDSVNITTVVPEPAPIALAGLWSLGLLARRRRA